MRIRIELETGAVTRGEQSHFARVGMAVFAGVILALYVLATLGALTARLLLP